MITGIEDSFTWANALDMVVLPVTQQGYDVHFYIRLVARGKQNNAGAFHVKDEGNSPVNVHQWQQNSHILGSRVNFLGSGTTSQVDITAWKDAVTRTPGAQVKFLELLDAKEPVEIPANPPHEKITSYEPKNQKVGRNLLRKFRSTEHLMHKVMDEERAGKFRYNFVMTTREDATWLSPLNMHTFDKVDSQNKAFSRNCHTYFGLNDKVFVFGREAAEKCLIGLYSNFWNNSLIAYNAEVYWKFWTRNKSVQSVTVDPTELAVSDTQWQNGKPCQSSHYHCAATYKKSAVVCVD